MYEIAMSPEDLNRIAASVGGKLPRAYCSLWERPFISADGFDGYLLDDPSAILGINREFRTGEFASEWNDLWFVVGNSASGNLFFIDLGDSEPAVCAWDHETHTVRVVAPSVGAFAHALASGADPDE